MCKAQNTPAPSEAHQKRSPPLISMCKPTLAATRRAWLQRTAALYGAALFSAWSAAAFFFTPRREQLFPTSADWSGKLGSGRKRCSKCMLGVALDIWCAAPPCFELHNIHLRNIFLPEIIQEIIQALCTWVTFLHFELWLGGRTARMGDRRERS